jgi:hypothetical protein
MDGKSEEKPKSKSAALGCGIMLLLFVVCAIIISDGDDNSNHELKSPETTREEKIESQFSGWDGSHRNLERFIKENMNDPNSYKHVETVYWDMESHLVVKTTYRGTNAFGGIVLNYIKAKIDLDGNITEILEQVP